MNNVTAKRFKLSSRTKVKFLAHENYYINKANYLLEKINEDSSSKQIIELDMWSWDFKQGPYTLYTVTDGQGNYPLSNDGSVFFTEHEDSANNLELDGKPHSNGKQLFIFEKDGSFGLYDENFVIKIGPFKSQREISQAIQELIEDRKIKVKGEEIFSI